MTSKHEGTMLPSPAKDSSGVRKREWHEMVGGRDKMEKPVTWSVLYMHACIEG
jgi:hypothetical protein